VLTFSYRRSNNNNNRDGAEDEKHGFGFQIIAYRRIFDCSTDNNVHHQFNSTIIQMVASLVATIANVNCDREVFDTLAESTTYTSHIWQSILASGAGHNHIEPLRQYLDRLASEPKCLIELLSSSTSPPLLIVDGIASGALLAVLIWNSSAKYDIIKYINDSTIITNDSKLFVLYQILASFINQQLPIDRRNGKPIVSIDEMIVRAQLLIENNSAPIDDRPIAELQSIMHIIVDGSYETLLINESCINLQVLMCNFILNILLIPEIAICK
jgi:hypothetical protein